MPLHVYLLGQINNYHITPILHELHWLPVEKRMTYKIFVITFNCLNNLALSYLSDLIIRHSVEAYTTNL